MKRSCAGNSCKLIEKMPRSLHTAKCGWRKEKREHLRRTRFTCPGIPRQIRRDPKLFGAPVAKSFEQRDQRLAGAAERIGDLRRRRAHRHSADDAILFQFT